MSVPAAITSLGKAAYDCGTFTIQFDNPNPGRESRRELARDFHVYLEVAMQAKHDAVMRGYCQQIGAQARRQDGTQVQHRPGETAESALRGFYTERAAVAAQAVKDQMVSRWEEAQPEGRPEFRSGERVDAAIQNQVQEDGFQYEISYWYETREPAASREVYVLFHCYPARR